MVYMSAIELGGIAQGFIHSEKSMHTHNNDRDPCTRLYAFKLFAVLCFSEASVFARRPKVVTPVVVLGGGGRGRG